jgi:signal transduction histidine kinase
LIFLITPEVNRFNEVTGSVVTIENVTSYRKMINEINDKNEKLSNYKIELEKRLVQLQETQEQLVISEKMAVIGQLVSGIAHEINTPLASIKANIDLEKMIIDMLQPEKTDSIIKFKETASELFEVNNIALERIIEIVKGLKNFARLDEAEVNIVNIHEGIDSTLLIIKNQASKNIKILKEYSEVPLIKCFPQQLNQVVLNMLINSIQAIKEEGSITVKTWSDNDKVYISIIDTGEGIPEDKIQKIFDPGYTTKGVGVGTGLGLSISYRIIEKHKGDIKVNSKVGEGTTITIELPINNEELEVKL